MYRSFCCALFLLSAAYSYGQSDDSASTGPEIDVTYQQTGRSGFHSNQTTLSEDQINLDISIPLVGNENQGVETDFILQRDYYTIKRFQSSVGLLSSPIARANVSSWQISGITPLNSQWSLLGVGEIGTYAASDAALSRSFAEQVSFGSVYTFAGTKAKLGLGLELENRVGGARRILPFPLIDWKITDQISLLSFDGSSGKLSYHVNRAVTLFGQLEFESYDLRLSKHSSLRSGIIREESFPVTAGIRWQINRHLSLSSSIGVAWGQTYRFETDGGSTVFDGHTHHPMIAAFELDFSV